MVQVESQAGSHLLATFTFCLGVACLTQWTFVRGSSIVSSDWSSLRYDPSLPNIPRSTLCFITPAMIHNNHFRIKTAV